MANLLYKVYFKVLVPSPKAERDMCITSPTPIRALDVFHKNVQTMKPMLKPEDYTITSLVHRYKDTPEAQGGTGAWIEAKVDLPATPNPQIAPQALGTPSVQVEMPLEDARLVDVKYEKADKTV